MIQNFRQNLTAPVNSGDVPNAANLHLEPSEIVLNSAQPNVLAAAQDVALMTFKMWAMVLLTGIGAGLTSGLLMRLLRLAQHLSFSYSMGDFLAGVRNTSERGEALWHWGDNGEFKCFVIADRKTKSGVVMFTNSRHGLAIAKSIVDEAMGFESLAFAWLKYDSAKQPLSESR